MKRESAAAILSVFPANKPTLNDDRTTRSASMPWKKLSALTPILWHPS